jgi:hypothetical protein
MRTKRYAEGDMVEEDMGRMSDLSSKMETGEGMQRMPKPKKDRVVSKKELEDSGLSLRDFLNKEKGLSRKEPENFKKRGFGGSETGGDAAIMYRKSMATGGKAFAKGGSVKEDRMEPAKMEKGGDLKKGNRPHGEHAIQLKGHTRAMMPKMGGNVIGTQSPKRK